jgi:stage V sporulation protein D (sporulation-specific penicillin-binding protein)
MTQIIGFTNIDTLGQSGLELFYNEYLQGVNGYQLTETDLIGREIDGNDIKYIPSIDGLNLNLTIDYYIQALAEKSVKSAYSTYNCKSATCIIMDPNSGQIKAIAQSPSFDLNNVPRNNVAELFSSMKSIAISNVYEPGSTFKVVTAAVGLETGLFSDKYAFYCPGYRIIDGQRIKCWKSIGHNSMTFSSGISNSCNCLFMDIATKVGVDSMYEFYYKLGLNKKTGIDISGEASGLLIEQSKVKTVDIARMGFGQAIAITPIEMLAAVSCVINGGYIVTPYILESVTDKNNNIIYRRNTIKGERIFSQKTSDSMRLYLEKVVTEGSGKKAAVSGYQIGGKTGTAQKYENGKIAQGKYISSFMGFTSVNNPEYVCLLIIDEPQGYLYYGSIVAAPYVGDIFANIFQYKGTEPYVDVTPEITYIMPDLIGLSTLEAAALLKNNKITYEIEGTGTVVYQFPAPNSECNTKTVAFIKLE